MNPLKFAVAAAFSAAALLGFAHVASAQIRIGQTAGFTGPVSAGVKETTDGAKLYFNAINAKGGINGQKIELLSLDDKFDPKLAAENARTLIEKDDVLAMFLTRGTPHTQAVIPVIDEHRVALVGPSTGAMVLHQPLQKHVFNVRATYQREAERAIAHLHAIGITRIGVVYVDDSFGEDGLAGAEKGFMRVNLKPVMMEKFNRSKPDFALITPKVVESKAQAILMVAASQAIVDGLKAFRESGSQAQLVTLSNNASGGFIKSMGALGHGQIVMQVFPSERSIASPMVRQALEMAQAQKAGQLSPAMLEGFAAAKVLVEGLRKAGRKPTREKLITALESLRQFDIGGFKVTYSDGSHTGLDFVDLSIIGADGQFKR